MLAYKVNRTDVSKDTGLDRNNMKSTSTPTDWIVSHSKLIKIVFFEDIGGQVSC